jgi:hypothetical protein
MLSGGLMLLIVSIMLGEYRNLGLLQISGQSLVAQIYLIGIITVVGFTDFYWLLRVTTPSLANTFAYVSPVIPVFLGWLLLHVSITILTIIVMGVILAGVALMVTTPEKRKEHQQIQKRKGITNNIIKGILSSPLGEVLFVSIDSSICGIVIKGESSISDVSFFSCAKVIPAFINSTPNVRAAMNVMIK